MWNVEMYVLSAPSISRWGLARMLILNRTTCLWTYEITFVRNSVLLYQAIKSTVSLPYLSTILSHEFYSFPPQLWVCCRVPDQNLGNPLLIWIEINSTCRIVPGHSMLLTVCLIASFMCTNFDLLDIEKNKLQVVNATRVTTNLFESE